MRGLVHRVRRQMAHLLRPQAVRYADSLIAQGDAARDACAHAKAAALYAEALRYAPGRAAIHVQAGHMFKESRDFGAALQAYTQAERLLPDDADLALQLGHFWKTADRPDKAAAQYIRAAGLAPGWTEPARELEALAQDAAAFPSRKEGVPPVPAWEMLPGDLPSFSATEPVDRIELRRLGSRREALPEGSFPVLSGVEAIRGVCFSDRPLVRATLLLDGAAIHHEVIASDPAKVTGVVKAVFNLWVDLTRIAPGFHRLEVVLADAAGWTRRRVEWVVVRTPGEEAGLSASDALVPPTSADTDVTAQVRARPSMVRSAGVARPAPPGAILVMRVDQLGDLVISIPALRRLRALFPKARIVGLLGAGNAGLAQTLGLFDEVLVADAPDDFARRRRTMTAEAQRVLAARLASYHFDVAIDLATSDASRPLLKLSGARFTFGFDAMDSPSLGGGMSGWVRDFHGGGEAAPQSGRVLALVERLGTIFAPAPPTLPRKGLDRAMLAPLGIAPGERFVVLHAGARVAWSRWLGFPALAHALLELYRLRVVLLATDAGSISDFPVHPLMTVLDQQLPFDVLDALLSFAAAFVGNDSGPKHLAALRGTPVVSIHCARINWAEWGQEQTGVVISRSVPCAGCAIFHDADECGKDFACVTDIRVDEVLTALEQLLPDGA